MLKVEQFQRSMMAKLSMRVNTAPLVNSSEFIVPMNSCIHYTSDVYTDMGMRGSHPFLQGMAEGVKLHTYHVREGYGQEGARTRNVPDTLIKQYFRSQRNFRRVNDLSRVIGMPKRTLVMDYSYANASLIYKESPRKNYNAFINIAEAYVKQINDIGNARNHFIALKFPETLPSRTRFNTAKDKWNNELLEEFINPEHFWFEELYNAVKVSEYEPSMERRRLINEIKAPESVYVSIHLGTNIVTFNLGSYLEQLEESEPQTRKDFYDLLTNLQETITDGDATQEEETNPATQGVEPGLVEMTESLVASGAMSSREQAAIIEVAKAIADIPGPTPSQTLVEYAAPVPSDNVIVPTIDAPVNTTLVNEVEAQSTVTAYRAQEAALVQKKMARAAIGLARGGLILKEYEVSSAVDALNDYDIYTMTFVNARGKEFTVKLEVPRVNEDGTFVADGVRYIMDTQKVDVPLRKASDTKVAITSYVGKLFVTRSTKVKDDWGRWLFNNISKIALDVRDERITKFSYGVNNIPKVKLARAYTALMQNLLFIEGADWRLFFGYDRRFEELGFDASVERRGTVLAGVKNDQPILMDGKGQLEVNGEVIGTVMDLIGGDWYGEPKEHVEMGVFGKALPLGIILMHMVGIDKMFKLLNIKYDKEAATVRKVSRPGYAAITLKDYRLWVDVSRPEVAMIANGLAKADKKLAEFTLSSLNTRPATSGVIMGYGYGVHIAREIEIMYDYFLDPFTQQYLSETMKEPDEIVPLLIRAAELCATDEHLNETDPRTKRLRGYERIPGFMYAAMVQAERERRGSGGAKVNLAPNTLWRKLTDDSTTQLVRDMSPGHCIKEKEAVSLAGEGGQSATTLVKKTRVFDEGDLGIFSEATPDSAKVGIRTFLTPNAQLADLNGAFGEGGVDLDPTALMSSVAMFLPACHHDDGKRINLASVQQSAVYPTRHYSIQPYRTPYDTVVASRVDKHFAWSAKAKGTVTKSNGKFIQVTYEDGTKDGQKLGVHHGQDSGKEIPHQIITDLKVGDTFEKGHVLSWNKWFFSRDLFSKHNVAFKTGTTAVVALVEGNDVLEDGDAMSERFAPKLMADSSKRKTFLFNADQGITNIVKVGDELDYDSPLLTITGAIDESMLDDESLLELQRLGNVSPKAGKTGYVSRIECVYMGDKEDMTPSLRAVVDQLDKQRALAVDSTDGRGARTGEIIKATFFGGEKVIEGTVAISIWVDGDLPAGIGDKISVVNQLKSVIGRIMTGVNQTEDGLPIDFKFGMQSVDARIVGSPIIIGIMNEIVLELNKQFLEIALGG